MSLDMVAFLLRLEVDPNVRDHQGRTPIHLIIEGPFSEATSSNQCNTVTRLTHKWTGGEHWAKMIRNLKSIPDPLKQMSVRGWGQNRVHPPSVRKINITIVRTLFSVSMASYQPKYMGFNQIPNFWHPRVTPGRP